MAHVLGLLFKYGVCNKFPNSIPDGKETEVEQLKCQTNFFLIMRFWIKKNNELCRTILTRACMDFLLDVTI